MNGGLSHAFFGAREFLRLKKTNQIYLVIPKNLHNGWFEFFCVLIGSVLQKTRIHYTNGYQNRSMEMSKLVRGGRDFFPLT